MIAHMLSNKKLNPKLIQLFIKGRKLNISFVFITEPHFAVAKILDYILHTFLL